ncbi:pyridoxal 5'-phosphate synthase lyase subunit PdxS [Candidatus Micrarchaeota archaeon]|nr:pyridoxal 5'-phosphate synthase lyase subunit PdxS [Candidatus Micrarchaeota archaeon]MBU2477121.1 pyridoxal 5'-phosphate synthase lyase subunit PdxS [Candidatus Micrarchaeota archaeon]
MDRKKVNRGLAKMLKGGCIMDVTNTKQALTAEKAGAVAVMALERIPADIRRDGGVARMSDPALIKKIMKTVSIPVMAKVRIGHFGEAQILEELKVDFIDESEVLTPADSEFHIDKNKFKTPFVCGAIDLGQALRRINEGASMIRTKGEAGTGNIIEAVTHIRAINDTMKSLKSKSIEAQKIWASKQKVPLDLLQETLKKQKLPVVNFAAGGIATPADVALVMQLGSEGVFVGSGIFKSSNQLKLAKAIVQATTYYNNPEKLAKASFNLGKAMKGNELSELKEKYASRGI